MTRHPEYLSGSSSESYTASWIESVKNPGGFLCHRKDLVMLMCQSLFL
ncbi:hypothetical protein RUMHYD_00230 [Blautia hydrogenotrophica DSM 10507]|uniref:Uncharacterized protein n=1 Tax=Blautia hydrogenotrophica (strain DSM 10507 / JCM 14656 / S5a33) TaxID=476272 RepID=C0CHB6_BLAHS|nr:hypothetical protein RUMHYD_00230 [Blautia hydrogenotrophica DSM 10507]